MKMLLQITAVVGVFGLLMSPIHGQPVVIDGTTLNGGFEDDAIEPDPWVLGGNSSISSAQARTGSNSLLQAAPGSFSVPTAYQTFDTAPGDVWDLSGYMLTPSTLPANATFGLLKIVWLNEFGGELQPVSPDPELIGSAITGAFPGIESTPPINNASTPGTWIFTQARGTAPAGTAAVRVFALTVDESAGTVYFDDITVLGTVRGVVEPPPLPVSIAPNGPDIDLTFPTKVGQAYTVETSTTLTDWTLAGVTLEGTGNVETATVSGAAPTAGNRVFFKVIEDLTPPVTGEVLVNGNFNTGDGNLGGWEAYAVWEQPKGTYIFDSPWGLADVPVVAPGDNTASFGMNTQLAAADSFWRGGYQAPMSFQQAFWTPDGPKAGNIVNLYGQVVTFTGNLEITEAYATGVIANISSSAGTVTSGPITHVLTGLNGNLSGTGAALNVRRDAAGAILSIARVNGGTGFVIDEQILIPGSLIGGTNGVDDITVTVTDTANTTVQVFLEFMDPNYSATAESVVVNVTNQGAGVIPFNLSATCPSSGLFVVQVGFRHTGVEGTTGKIRVSNLSVTAANP